MKVHELLNRPERWTKGAMARYRNGEPCDPMSPDASCFCLGGAIQACYPIVQDELQVYARVCQNGVSIPIGDWNDAEERTFEEVRSLALKLNI